MFMPNGYQSVLTVPDGHVLVMGGSVLASLNRLLSRDMMAPRSMRHA